MTKYAKLIHQNDNVITVVADCKPGDHITVKFQEEEFTYTCNQDGVTAIDHSCKICKPIKTASLGLQYTLFLVRANDEDCHFSKRYRRKYHYLCLSVREVRDCFYT